jgi:hypothetical protein
LLLCWGVVGVEEGGEGAFLFFLEALQLFGDAGLNVELNGIGASGVGLGQLLVLGCARGYVPQRGDGLSLTVLRCREVGGRLLSYLGALL